MADWKAGSLPALSPDQDMEPSSQNRGQERSTYVCLVSRYSIMDLDRSIKLRSHRFSTSIGRCAALAPSPAMETASKPGCEPRILRFTATLRSMLIRAARRCQTPRHAHALPPAPNHFLRRRPLFGLPPPLGLTLAARASAERTRTRSCTTRRRTSGSGSTGCMLST